MKDTSVNITTDTATPTLRRIYSALVDSGQRRSFLGYAAGRIARKMRTHFRDRDASGDSARARRGWPSRHFWSDAARATQVTEITDARAVVTIASEAVAHKESGGTITPKRGQYLAIPLRAEAYAAGAPREWDATRKLLFPVRSKSGRLFLCSATMGSEAGQFVQQRGPLGARGLIFQYLLVRSVNQAADPDVVRMNELEAEAEASANDYYEARLDA